MTAALLLSAAGAGLGMLAYLLGRRSTLEEARRARLLANLDSLTGLYNRRAFQEALTRETARAGRYGRRFALVVLDLDDFKAVNDRLGHLVGDSVLAQVGQRVRDVVRAADVPYRVGGDEFAIILPESTLDDAEQLAHRLQARISSRPFARAGRLFVSVGVAELESGDDPAALFRRADVALYRAKGVGKRRAVARRRSQPAPPEAYLPEPVSD